MARKYRGGSWAHLNMLRRGARNSAGAVVVLPSAPTADAFTLGRTFTDGGANDSAPVMNVIDNTGREISAFGFSNDGLYLVAAHNAAQGPGATFQLSTAWDFSTATQIGVSNTHGVWNFPYGNMWFIEDYDTAPANTAIVFQGTADDAFKKYNCQTNAFQFDANNTAHWDNASLPIYRDTDFHSQADSSDGSVWYDHFNGLHHFAMIEIPDPVLNTTWLQQGGFTSAHDYTTKFTDETKKVNMESYFSPNPTPYSSGMAMAEDGQSMLYWNGGNKTLYRWEFSTAWDVTTLTNVTTNDYSSDLVGVTTHQAVFAKDLSRFWVIERFAPNHKIVEFTTS